MRRPCLDHRLDGVPVPSRDHGRVHACEHRGGRAPAAWRCRWWAGAASLLLLAWGASAATCTPTSPSAGVDDLLALLPSCERDADWLFTLGGRLIDAGRYEEAADHLERALLLRPEAAEFQLAYAIALAGSGDVVSSLTLLRDLQARADLPASLTEAVTSARSRWAAPPPTAAGPVRRVSAGLRIGHDSNLLGAPNASSLSLTLPNETIILPLEPSSLPKPGAYRRADVRFDGTFLVGPQGRLDASVGLLDRSSPAVREANARQVDLQLEWVRSAPPRQLGWYVGTSANDLRTEGGAVMRSHGLAAGAEWRPASAPQCEMRAGIDWQERRLASNAVLSGRFWGLAGIHACQEPARAGANAQRRQWSWRVGQDSPLDDTRPGGRQSQFGVRGTWAQGDVRSGAWVLDADVSHQRDRNGYSALLDNGARRTITRLTGRVEYQRQVRVFGSTAAVFSAGVDFISQHSNLELFRTRSWGPYVGIRASF